MIQSNLFRVNNNIVFAVVIAVVVAVSNAAVIVHDVEDEFNNTKVLYSVPLFYNQGPNYQNINITGTLIYHSNTSPLITLNGYVVLFDNDALLFESHFREFQKKGALGVLVGQQGASKVPGQLMYHLDGTGYSDLTIPIAQLRFLDYFEYFKPLLIKGYEINVTVTFYEENPWKTLNEGWFMKFFSIIIGVGSFILLLESCRRLFYTLYYNYYVNNNHSNNGNKIKVNALICLGFQAVSNIIRIIFCVDPLRSYRIYNTASAASLIIAPHFLALIPKLMLAFCLHDIVVSKKIKVATFLDTLRIPFIITTVSVSLFGVVALIVVSQRILGAANSVGTALTVIVYLVSLALALYFGFVANQILTTMRKTSKYSKNLFRASIKLGIVTGGILAQTIIGISIIYPISYSPISYNCIYLFVFLIELFVSGAIISFFDSDGTSKSSTSASLNSRNPGTESHSSSKSGTKGGDGENVRERDETPVESQDDP